MIVGGGVVLAASYEAKVHGVRTAMGGRQARRLCPDAIVVPPRMSAYSEAEQGRVRGVRGHDAAGRGALDRRGLPRRPRPRAASPARRSRSPPGSGADVRERVGLPITVGVARTKFLAKVASGVAKPNGLLVVAPDRERAFLLPLPVERLWGVGPVTAGKLHDRGVATVGQVAALGEGALVSLLGRAVGRAPARPRRRTATRGSCAPAPAARSIGSQRALGRGPRTAAEIDASLIGLVDRVTRRMRAAGRVGRTVVLRLRFGDFSRATRSHTLRRSTAQTQTILVAMRGLLAAATPMIERRGLTLIGVAVTNLEDAGAASARAAVRARSAARRSTRRSTRCGGGSDRRR